MSGARERALEGALSLARLDLGRAKTVDASCRECFHAGVAAGARLFEETLRTLPLAAAVFDRDMRYVAHNRAWLRVHGLEDGGDLTGRKHYEVFPDLPEQYRRVNERGLAGETVTRDLDAFTRSDGTTEHLRWVVTPWGEAEGRVSGIIIYAEIITEQVRTRRSLDEHASLIRALFEQSPIGLNLCTLDGLWLQSNRAFCEIIGYSPEEADGGLTYWQLTPRKYDAQEKLQLETLRTQRRYGPYEKEFIRKDGTLVPVRLNGFLVEREGQTYIWSLIEDLTAQRALESDLENERLKAIQASKLATVGQLAAGVAHELNNPLGIIDAYAFSLQDAHAPGDEARIDEAVRAIRGATARAGKIVQGLRRFTRQSKNDPPEEIAVARLVEEAVGLCNARMRDHGVELAVDVASDARVRGRSVELEQVLVNLLNNAIDAVRDSDRRRIRVHVVDDAESVRIAVEDSGPGVPPEVVDELFRAFFTTKKVGEGTGLGLSISRSIVERHGGTITYDGAAPTTRFIVILPRIAP